MEKLLLSAYFNFNNTYTRFYLKEDASLRFRHRTVKYVCQCIFAWSAMQCHSWCLFRAPTYFRLGIHRIKKSAWVFISLLYFNAVLFWWTLLYLCSFFRPSSVSFLVSKCFARIIKLVHQCHSWLLISSSILEMLNNFIFCLIFILPF